MSLFDHSRATRAHEAFLHHALHGVEQLPSDLASRVIRAWSLTWSNSSFAGFNEIPISPGLDYPLLRHVNDVTRVGLSLRETTARMWDRPADRETLLCILLLHDVDKPMLFERADGALRGTPISTRMPHGVLGALLLAELGFPELVISTVATHATDAPFHGSAQEAFLLHYADMISFDAAALESGGTPFFQRHQPLRGAVSGATSRPPGLPGTARG